MSLFDTPFDPAREAALVTGAGNGIGRAIAQALVGEGVRTVFADVNADTVKAAVKASPRPELALPWVGGPRCLAGARRSRRRKGDALRALRLAAAA
jgi:3-oxoacyl-[acyl-carrier protein] reductase